MSEEATKALCAGKGELQRVIYKFYARSKFEFQTKSDLLP